MKPTQPDYNATLEAVRILLTMPNQFKALGFSEVEKGKTDMSSDEAINKGTGLR